MINVTPSAIQKIQEYLGANGIDSSIRVTLIEGGCSGPALGIVLDKAAASDRIFQHQGIDFIMHESLLAECGTVTINFVEPDETECRCGGFRILSERPVTPSHGCSCSTGS